MPTQTIDLLTNGAGAIVFDAPGLTWKIDDGVTVGADFGFTVLSGEEDSTLINKGLIVNTTFGGQGVVFTGGNSSVINKGQIVGGASGFGLNFLGDNMRLINKSGANIVGGTAGVVSNAGLSEEGGYVENHGTIGATDTFGFGVYASYLPEFVLMNYGEIGGPAAGVRVLVSGAVATAGPKVVNHGLIEGDKAVDLTALEGGYRVKIVNKPDGVIHGASAAIENLAIPDLRLVVKNKGLIDGDVIVKNGTVDDKIVNTGKIKGDVRLGEGDDLIDNTDGQITKKLAGEDGNDTFILGEKEEIIVFDAALNEATNLDVVQCFESGTDQFRLDNGVFTALSEAGALAKANFRKATEAQDTDDHIIYDKASGALYYDLDGNVTGGVAQVQFAQLDPGTGLKYSDFAVFA